MVLIVRTSSDFIAVLCVSMSEKKRGGKYEKKRGACLKAEKKRGARSEYLSAWNYGRDTTLSSQ